MLATLVVANWIGVKVRDIKLSLVYEGAMMMKRRDLI